MKSLTDQTTVSLPAKWLIIHLLLMLTQLNRVLAGNGQLTTHYTYDRNVLDLLNIPPIQGPMAGFDNRVPQLNFQQHERHIPHYMRQANNADARNLGQAGLGYHAGSANHQANKHNLVSSRLPSNALLSFGDDEQPVPLRRLSTTTQNNIFKAVIQKPNAGRKLTMSIGSLEADFINQFVWCLYGKQALACELAAELIEPKEQVGHHHPTEQKYHQIDGSTYKAHLVKISLFKQANTLRAEKDAPVDVEATANEKSIASAVI